MDSISEAAPKDILVVVFSKTPEKVAHFQLAADGSRAAFIDIHRLVEGYNVAPEDTGDRYLNADQKARAIISTLEKLKDPNSAEHQNLIRQCQELGIPYDENKIFGMVEDSTFSTSPEVWLPLKERLRPLISDDLLKNYSGENAAGSGGESAALQSGPGAETGLIVAATGGFVRFYNLLRLAYMDALKSAKGQSVDGNIKGQCTVVLRPLNAPEQTYEFDSEAAYQLMQPPDGQDYEGNHHITEAYDYVALPGNDSVPISNDLKNYIAKHGVRARVFEKMSRAVFALLPETAPSAKLAEQNAAARHATQWIRPKTYEPDSEDREKTLREKIYEIINREALIGTVGREGLILKTFNPANAKARRKAFYDLTCVVVAKQLIARDMFKPLLLWDDGCWQPIIKILASLANKGMAKDFIPFVKTLVNPDIKHIVSSFFDCLQFDPHKYDRDKISSHINDETLEASRKQQADDLRDMSDNILRERAVGHHDFIEPQQLTEIRSEGAPPDGEIFTVAHFVSASSENKTVIEQSQSFGAHLAAKGIGYVWGGMNMHSGGAAFKAYKAAGGIHAAAYSTIPIAAAETENGTLPEDADYREWSRNIYERMAGMIAASDVIVVSLGGWGTLQEWLALMVLKDQAPELFANKKIIIHNPPIHDGEDFSGNPFWNRSIRAIFDVHTRNRDWSSVRDKNVYIVHNDGELNTLTDRLHQNRMCQHKTASKPQCRADAAPGALVS